MQVLKKIVNRNTYKAVGVFLLPALVIYLIFVIYPLLKVFRLSFYRWRGISAGSEVFIGFGNFIDLFHDPVV